MAFVAAATTAYWMSKQESQRRDRQGSIDHESSITSRVGRQPSFERQLSQRYSAPNSPSGVLGLGLDHPEAEWVSWANGSTDSATYSAMNSRSAEWSRHLSDGALRSRRQQLEERHVHFSDELGRAGLRSASPAPSLTPVSSEEPSIATASTSVGSTGPEVVAQRSTGSWSDIDDKDTVWALSFDSRDASVKEVNGRPVVRRSKSMSQKLRKCVHKVAKSLPFHKSGSKAMQ